MHSVSAVLLLTLDLINQAKSIHGIHRPGHKKNAIHGLVF